MYHIEFKGLGFAFELSPVAFEIFGKPVYWYGIIITLGIILSVAYAFYRLKQAKVNVDDMYDYAIFTIIFGIIGARLYYVLTNLDTYTSLSSAIAIWNGGLAIYGGVIGGALAITAVALLKKKNPLIILDCVAPATMIGQLIGRWGNFMNQEAFGTNTDLPWGMRSWVVGDNKYYLTGTVEYLERYKSKIEAENPGMQVVPNGYVHPTFLYESLWNLIGFIIINLLYKKKKFNGQILLMYLTWYGFGRMLIESLRTDSLYLPGTQFRISQLIGLICFVAGAVLLMLFYIKAKNAPAPVSATEAEENNGASNETEQPDDDISQEDIDELKALDGCEDEDMNTENSEEQDGNDN